MGTLTMKFGGASVGTTAALMQVVSILLQERERWQNLIVVVSALEGVTDSLIEASHLAQLSNRRGYRRIVATLRTRHLTLVDNLPLNPDERVELQAEIDRLLFDMLDICQMISESGGDTVSAQTIDAVISVGERLATRIVAALMRHNGLRGVALDATEVIVTDATFGNARPNMDLTRERIHTNLLPMLERGIIPVITGFIGGTRDGKPTTLGRGGSDYSASIIGVCTEATEVWMWASVDGMMSTDPQHIDSARVIPYLSYEEVAELAYFGARILHARMIEPLRESNTPLHIKNIFKPQSPGTIVFRSPPRSEHYIKAVTAIQGIGLSSDQSGTLVEITDVVNTTLDTTIGSPADIMITAQSLTRSFMTVVIPTSAGPDAVHSVLVELEKVLAARPGVAHWKVMPVSIITAIGPAMDWTPRVSARIFEVLDDIRILAISQGPSHCSLSIVTEPQYADSAVRKIHALAL